MDDSPFRLPGPYRERLRIGLFSKTDGAPSPAEIGAVLGADATAKMHQVHGNRTIVARSPMDATEQADGMITDRPGLALLVRAADCQPFVIYAPERGVVGVLHTGWKGVIGGAIEEFFAVLKNEWGIAPEETLVCIGPSLCMDCAEYADPTHPLRKSAKAIVCGNDVDLPRMADRVLRQAGVSPDRMERHADCTRCHPERYWTYRGGDRDAVTAGTCNTLAALLLP